MRSTTRRKILIGAIVAALGSVLAVGAAAPAYADPVNITLTVVTPAGEYGQGWGFQGTVNGIVSCEYQCPPDLVVTVDGVTKDLGPNQVYGSKFYVTDQDFQPANVFGIGQHTLSAKLIGGPEVQAQSNTPATFTVTKTAIVATTTIAPDPNNSGNAIITAQLSGKYIEQLPNCQCEGQNGYLMPAGTWTTTVTDPHDKTVFTKQLDLAANGPPTFVNYWPSAPPGETFTAESVFTVTDGTKSDFAVTSQKFSWTSKKGADEQANGSPSSAPKPITAKKAAFAPPLAVFWGALLVILILIALDVILFVNRRRSRGRRPAPEKEVES